MLHKNRHIGLPPAARKILSVFTSLVTAERALDSFFCWNCSFSLCMHHRYYTSCLRLLGFHFIFSIHYIRSCEDSGAISGICLKGTRNGLLYSVSAMFCITTITLELVGFVVGSFEFYFFLYFFVFSHCIKPFFFFFFFCIKIDLIFKCPFFLGGLFIKFFDFFWLILFI